MEARCLTLARLAGVRGGWGVGERIGASEGGRQAAPKAENMPFWGSAPTGIFCR